MVIQEKLLYFSMHSERKRGWRYSSLLLFVYLCVASWKSLKMNGYAWILVGYLWKMVVVSYVEECLNLWVMWKWLHSMGSISRKKNCLGKEKWGQEGKWWDVFGFTPLTLILLWLFNFIDFLLFNFMRHSRPLLYAS